MGLSRERVESCQKGASKEWVGEEMSSNGENERGRGNGGEGERRTRKTNARVEALTGPVSSSRTASRLRFWFSCFLPSGALPSARVCPRSRCQRRSPPPLTTRSWVGPKRISPLFRRMLVPSPCTSRSSGVATFRPLLLRRSFATRYFRSVFPRCRDASLPATFILSLRLRLALLHSLKS